jgi:glucosamine--fructose-6-phosphate aminotransferase (isomerizing)
MHHAVVAGRGLNYATAFEFALKLMETCYIVAERFSSADFLHGPIAMIEPNFPLFLFTPSGPTWTSMQEMLMRLRDLKAETVVVTDRRNLAAANLASRVISIPARIPEIYSPIPYIIPAQLFAAALAVEKNLDPDRPRALSKITRTL